MCVSAFNQVMLFVMFVLWLYVIENELFQCQFNVCIKKVYYIIIYKLYNMNVYNEALINKIRHVIKNNVSATNNLFDYKMMKVRIWRHCTIFYIIV